VIAHNAAGTASERLGFGDAQALCSRFVSLEKNVCVVFVGNGLAVVPPRYTDCLNTFTGHVKPHPCVHDTTNDIAFN
jgi:hypothetical protein